MKQIKNLGILTLCLITLLPAKVQAANNLDITLQSLRDKKIIWNKPYPEKSINHKNLKERNPDYIGWMTFDFAIPDYKIHLDEPVVFETEPDYYLHHDFYDNPDKNGCIFMDMQSDKSLYGYNDFLYAHHAENQTLFGTLNHIYEFDDIEYLKENPQYMYFYTETAVHKYVLAGYEQIPDSNNHYAYTTCENEQMYLEYINYLKSLPDFINNKEIPWDCNPPVLNFSTCDGPPGTANRFVVHFVKIAAYAT